VAAGSLPSTTATGYDFKGNIGKIKLNSRGNGYTDLTTNCTFISSIQPVVKVKDLTKVIDSNVITVNGTFPIDATYPRLKQ
jgi:hypothetical protein